MACVEACKTSSLHYVEKKTTVAAGWATDDSSLTWLLKSLILNQTNK
jgi:Fe-S-cluster-containing hydrogenase component 2